MLAALVLIPALSYFLLRNEGAKARKSAEVVGMRKSVKKDDDTRALCTGIAVQRGGE